MIAYLRRRHGDPMRLEPGDPAGGFQWRNDSARITTHRGKDLVFVSFELASYADAVKRKREGVSLECS